MDRAYNKYGKEVYIDAIVEGEQYFCPMCQQVLSLRINGTLRDHCFAHYPVRSSHSGGYTKCTETWHYDMSEWHKGWQRRFPEENRERIITGKDGKRHIADILINDTVIEFQNSGISTDEFRERNTFYKGCGYKVIWLFNVQSEVDNGAIEYSDEYSRNNRWSYKRLRKPFKDLKPNKEDATIYMEFPRDADEIPSIERLLFVDGYKRYFETSTKNHTVTDFYNLLLKDPSSLIPLKEKEIDEEDAARYKEAGGKTVYELWDDNYKSMVIRNISTGKEMIVYGHGGELSLHNEYGREVLKGQYTWKENGKYKYSDKYYVVKNANKPVWTLKYGKPRDKDTEEAELKRSQEEALVRQKMIEEQNRRQNERERLDEEKRKAEEEAQRQAQIKKALEERKAYEMFIENIEEYIKSDDTVARDPRGTRWIKCKKCGRISTEKDFWSYGGRGSLNYGYCYDCSESR